MPIMTKSKQTQADTPDAEKRTAGYRGRIPVKPNINLALVGVKRTRWWLAIPAIILIFLVAAVFGKFLVYDRLQEVSAAQAEVAAVQAEIAKYEAKIAEYGELNELFAHYTYSGMTTEEQGRVDRIAVMDLIQRVVMPQMEVSRWELNGNCLQMTVEGDTLQKVNLTAQELLRDELVSYCEVNTAATDTTTKKTTVNPEKVAANIVVYLVKPEEVANK